MTKTRIIKEQSHDSSNRINYTFTTFSFDIL
jgi:hypothetical protein